MDVLAQATGASAFNETCPALIAKAAKLQQALPLQGLRASMRGASSAIDEVRDATGVSGAARSLTREFAEVDANAQQLAAAMIAGGAVRSDDLEDAMLHADEIAVRARVQSAVEQLEVLKAQASVEGVWEELAALPSSDFHAMRAALPLLVVEISQVADDMRMEHAAQEAALDATGDERRAAMRRYRRDALTRAQVAFAKIQANENIGEFLRNGAKLVQRQQFRTACVKVAAMVGVSLAAGALAGAAGDALELAAGGGTKLVGLARAGQITLEVGVDAGVNTAGQFAMAGLDRRPPPEKERPGAIESMIENLIVVGGSRGILAGIQAEAKALETIEEVQVVRANEALNVAARGTRAGAIAWEGAAIAGHTLMGAGISFAAHKLVASKKDLEAAAADGSLTEWFLQGASIAVSRHLGTLLGRARKRLEHMAAPRELREANAALARRAQAMLTAGEQVDPAAALELMVQAHEQLVAEEQAARALKDDPARLSAAGISAGEAAAMAADAQGDVRAMRDPSQVAVPLQLAGLEEAVPGAMWRGTREQAIHAIDAARRMGIDIVATHDPDAHRWKVKGQGVEFEILERIPGGPSLIARPEAGTAAAGEVESRGSGDTSSLHEPQAAPTLGARDRDGGRAGTQPATAQSTSAADDPGASIWVQGVKSGLDAAEQARFTLLTRRMSDAEIFDYFGGDERIVRARMHESNLPNDLILVRASLSGEGRRSFDYKWAKIVGTGRTPSTAKTSAFRRFLDSCQKRGDGDLDRGLRDVGAAIPADALVSEPRAESYPPSWDTFQAGHHEEFKAELQKFRESEDQEPDHRGGEGAIFLGQSESLALKRWFARRIGDFAVSVAKLRSARALVHGDAALGELIEVVEIHRVGTDWILRDFDTSSVELRAVSEGAAESVRLRAIELLRSRGPSSEAGTDLLRKLEARSANLHWSGFKILVIDMQ